MRRNISVLLASAGWISLGLVCAVSLASAQGGAQAQYLVGERTGVEALAEARPPEGLNPVLSEADSAHLGPAAQPSPRPTIDTTATAQMSASQTAAAQPPPGASPPLPATIIPTSAPPASATATRVRPRPTSTPTGTETPTSLPTTARPATATPGPPIEHVIATAIRATLDALASAAPTATPTATASLAPSPAPPTAAPPTPVPVTPDPSRAFGSNLLMWIVLLIPLMMLLIALAWLARGRRPLPAVYPPRGRPRRALPLPGRRRGGPDLPS